MKLKNEIENVRAFLPNKEVIFKNNEIISLKQNSKNIVDNALRLFDLKTSILVLDDLNFIDSKINYKVHYVSLPYLGIYTKKPKYVDGVYNYSENKVLFETEHSLNGLFINDNYIFTDDITCRNINNGEKLWHFDLSQFGAWKNFENKDKDYEVEQFIGIANNCLYVLLSNFKLIALNVENGHLVQQLNLGEQFALEDRNWLSNSSKMYLDEANNRIIWLTSATLLHIDLATFKAKLIKDYFNVPLENLWRFKRSNFQEQQLLFTAQNGREGGDPDIVGIMNPDTGEILWQYQITETQGLYEEPQLANNKLYVKSLDNVLYIFEKE